MWIVYAILSAFFAALTTIFAKVGISGVNSNLATAIRTGVVLILSWVIVYISGANKEMSQISSRSWLFLILSGIATGLSWLCYYKALQIGDASKVVPIDKFSIVITMILAFFILKEPITLKTLIGALLITGGVFFLIF